MYRLGMVSPSENYCVSKLVAVRQVRPGGSELSGLQKDSQIFGQTEWVESLKDGEEVAVKRGDSLGLPADSCTVVALGDRIEWVTFVGCSALNEALLPTGWTWNNYRQSPLGRPDWTMGRPVLDRCGMGESKRAGSVVGSEGEGPE